MTCKHEQEFNECPACGGGPVYQDRIDASRNEAHCDDCGETFTQEEYEKIVGGGKDDL